MQRNRWKNATIAMATRYDHDAREVLARFYQPVVGAGAIAIAVTNGMSGAVVWQVTPASGAQAPTFALRRWPQAGPDVRGLDQMHAVLQHAKQRGVEFVPAPQVAGDSATRVRMAGAWWELADWMPGVPAAAAQAKERLPAAIAALRRFHAATADAPPSASAGRETAIAGHCGSRAEARHCPDS